MRRIQLDFIDGMRALLALYIVVHHTVQLLGFVPDVLVGFGYGQAVVAVFITVSGFCLALPQASAGKWTIDARSFFLRRARRILPPYYAALLLSVVVSASYKWMGPFHDPVGEFSFAGVWSHVLLIQNWLPGQMYTLNGPLWSIALECQIYLLYPVMVVLRRRLTSLGMLAVVVLFASAAFRLLHAAGQPQFLIFFALGVLSAEMAFRKKRLWIPLSMVLAAGTFCLLAPHLSTPMQEACASLASAGLLTHLAQEQGNPLRRMLGWRPVAWVGTFSYSIYLLHDLFVASGWYWMRNREAGFGTRLDVRFLFFTLVVGTMSVAGSYGFHVVFERPFMSAKRQKAEQRLATT